MSSGGLSYSGLINYGKSTLPSVDSWGTNMHIIKDPLKSIMTRRKDKVGQDNIITDTIDESGSRINEAISHYARGVNPCVSVSYSNNSNNGGQRSQGIIPLSGGNKQAFLPYRVARDGAFRPPILRQENKLPLSRLPRGNTNAYTQPGRADYSKRTREAGTAENTKEVKNSILKTSVTPTATYNIQNQITEPYEIKYIIQPALRVSADTNIQGMNITEQNVLEPSKNHIVQNMNRSSVTSNTRGNGNVSYIHDDIELQRNLPMYSSNTNVSENIYKAIDHNDIDLYRNLPVYSSNTNMSENIYKAVDHNDIELGRNLPEYSSNTNVSENIYKYIEPEHVKTLNRNTPLTNMTINPGSSQANVPSNLSYTYNLQPKINAGGYHIPSSIPMTDRMQNMREENYETDKSRMLQAIAMQQDGRYTY